MPQPDPGLTDRITQRLAQAVGQRRYELWIQPSVRLDYRGGEQTLHVTVPNRFIADKIRADFSGEIRDATRAEAGIDPETQLHVELRVEPDRFTPAATSPPGPAPDRAKPAATPRPVPRSASGPAAHAGVTFRHGFEDFVVGPSNELAFAAAQALADAETTAHPTATTSLFLHGECGLGKTHLLQATCRRTIERRPDARVLYLTAEQFTNRYITAVRSNTLEAFRRELRRLDLLAVDDIGFFANKEKTQQEFLHSFDHVELRGARVILASDSHPRLVKQFSQALVSRCLQGLVVQVQPPDDATRLALIHRLAKRRGLVLAGSVDERLAAHAGQTVREIEGTIAQLHALASLAQPHTAHRVVDRALAERLLHGQRSLAARRPVRFEDICATACESLNVTPDQVAGSSRHRQIVLARALVVYLAKQMTTHSYPEIAAALGKPSHSTVVTAVQRMTRQLEANDPLLLPGRAAPVTPVQLVEEIRRLVLQRING